MSIAIGKQCPTRHAFRFSDVIRCTQRYCHTASYIFSVFFVISHEKPCASSFKSCYIFSWMAPGLTG